MTAFLNVAPCSLLDETALSEVHTASIIRGRKHLWNVDQLTQAYMAK